MNDTATSVHPAPSGAGLFFDRALGRDRRHLLGLEGLSRDEITALLDDAEAQRSRLRARAFPADDLRGITVCVAMLEDSTRTRISFELAAQRLGAMVVTFGAAGSSLSKGETLLDTFRVVQANHVDLVCVRHRSAGLPHDLARHTTMGIINAGDGEHEHPTQGLLDLLALRDAWHGRFEGRRLAIVGDLGHSRVARSAIFGALTMGVEVVVAGPPTLVPAGIESLGVTLAPTIEDAMRGADAVMALRLQRERMEAGLLPSLGEYARVWGVNLARLALLAPDAVVLHPGPVNRGVELASDVMDGPRAVIFEQVENGAAVRLAVLRRSAAAVREAAR